MEKKLNAKSQVDSYMKDSNKFLFVVFALSALLVPTYLNVSAMKMSDSMMKDVKSQMENSMMINHMDPPHKQMKMGISSHDIQCKTDYNLVFKSTDWSPACVRQSSITRLVEIGWAASEEKMMMMEKESMMKDTGEHMGEKSMMTNSIGGVDISMASPVEGSLDTAITIIEFGDYQCPKCDQWFKNEKPAITSSFIDTNKVKLYFVDFPFLGEDSLKASEASYCADDQGKYWEYHSALYNNQGGIQSGWASVDALKQFASDIDLDRDQFDSCLDSGKYSDRVTHNKQVGISSGVEGTPTFFIVSPTGNVEKIVGPQPSSVFSNIIEQMLS